MRREAGNRAGRRRYGAIVLAFCAVALVAAGCSDDDDEGSAGVERTASEATSLSPILVNPRRDAIPVSGSDGRTHLLYELTIQNVTPLELGVAEIEISDPEGTVIRTLDAEETADALSLPAARRGNEALADGQSGLLF
jgi:hypothetical protein